MRSRTGQYKHPKERRIWSRIRWLVEEWATWRDKNMTQRKYRKPKCQQQATDPIISDFIHLFYLFPLASGDDTAIPDSSLRLCLDYFLPR